MTEAASAIEGDEVAVVDLAIEVEEEAAEEEEEIVDAVGGVEAEEESLVSREERKLSSYVSYTLAQSLSIRGSSRRTLRTHERRRRAMLGVWC